MRAEMTQADKALTSCRCQQLLPLAVVATVAAVDAACGELTWDTTVPGHSDVSANKTQKQNLFSQK